MWQTRRKAPFSTTGGDVKLAELAKKIDRAPAYIAAHLVGKINLEEQKLDFKDWHAIFSKCISDKNGLRALAFQRMTELASTVSEWHTVFRNTDGEELKFSALRKMQELASSFEDWSSVRSTAEGIGNSANEQKKSALRKMADLASSFDHWCDIYLQGEKDRNEEVKALALKEMDKQAGTFKEWSFRQFDYAPKHRPEVRFIVIKKMVETASSFDECFGCYCEPSRFVHGDYSRDLRDAASKLYELAKRKVITAARNFDELLKVYKEFFELRGYVFQRMRQFSFSFQKWRRIYKSLERKYGLGGDRELVCFIARKMAKVASTLDEWKAVYGIFSMCPGHSKMENKALEKVFALACTLSDLCYVYYRAGRKLRNSVRSKIGGLCHSFEDWYYVYNHVSGDLRKLAYRRIKELNPFLSFKEWRKIYRHCGSGNELGRLALRKMGEFLD